MEGRPFKLCVLIKLVLISASAAPYCGSKILRILYKDNVSNEGVRAKIQQAIGSHEDLLTIVKRRKLQGYGHVYRSSGLTNTILQGTVKGGKDKADRRRGGKTISGNGQA